MANIKDVDRKLLWARSGDECAFPGCTQRLTMLPNGSGESSSRPVVVGQEAHIVAEEDNGPRGDPSMPVSERNAYPNLILLCPTHHTLIDKDRGIHFSVAELLRMKADHEALVESRRMGSSDQHQTFLRQRQDRLLEASSASRGRLIAGWVAAGVSSELAQSLADDNGVGAPSRLQKPLPDTGLVVLEGDFGSGKSVTGERVHAEDVYAALEDESAPLPLYLLAKSVTGSLGDFVGEAFEGLGDPRRAGLHLVLDGLDEPGPARASTLLNEARSLAFTWPNSRVVVTSRPGLDLNKEERLPYPPLSEDEATALAERLGSAHSVMWGQSEAVRTMLHLPLFLIVAVLRQQAGVDIPRSQGTFLEALADAALKRTHYPTEEAGQALRRLARLTVASGGSIAAAELGSDEAVRSALETRLAVRTGRSLRFALPVVEQYFAAQTVLESGLAELDLSDLRGLDRWRDSLTLAVTVGSWRQVSQLLETLVGVHPGLASWLVANAVPASTTVVSTELPGHVECARRLRQATAGWVNALGAVGRRLGLTDGTGQLRTVGAFVENDRVFGALRLGETTGVDAVQLPYALNPFTGKAPDGSEWAPLRLGHTPADFMAWPWQWGLDWVTSSIEPILRMKSLPLPDTQPFQDERRWTLSKAIMRQTGSINHKPLSLSDLQERTEQLLALMTEHNARVFRPHPRRMAIFHKDDIAKLSEALTAGDVGAADGMLHRPYPAPDTPPGGSGHVSSVYSDEALRSLTEQVYANALVIYHDLVSAWFPTFTPTLGLACILPVAFQAQLVPRAGSWDGPDFVYQMNPLPVGQTSTASVRLLARREDLNVDWETALEEGRKRRQLIAILHPGAEGWAQPRSANATLEVYRDMPATAQAYHWLWEDLRALHTVKQIPPVDVD